MFRKIYNGDIEENPSTLFLLNKCVDDGPEKGFQ